VFQELVGWVSEPTDFHAEPLRPLRKKMPRRRGDEYNKMDGRN
jgi:hypothetical protein